MDKLTLVTYGLAFIDGAIGLEPLQKILLPKAQALLGLLQINADQIFNPYVCAGLIGAGIILQTLSHRRNTV